MSNRLSRWLFHQITVKDYTYTPESGVREAESDQVSDGIYLDRMQGHLSFGGKSVLDVGCGHGTLCVRAVREGAAGAVGVDLDVSRAEERIRENDSDIDIDEKVEFVQTAGQLNELQGRQFDLVISKDSMEHFPDPEKFVHLMTSFVKPGGELAIGFSPLWKSPKGGHINYMTRVPWAHLMFSEETIMTERRRFRPHENANSFSEIVGGLNKMTLSSFQSIMASTGLEPVYLDHNVGDRRSFKAMRLLAKIPPLREYFTLSVYSIWRKPL